MDIENTMANRHRTEMTGYGDMHSVLRRVDRNRDGHTED
jgi:hypothetical protein